MHTFAVYNKRHAQKYAYGSVCIGAAINQESYAFCVIPKWEEGVCWFGAAAGWGGSCRQHLL